MKKVTLFFCIGWFTYLPVNATDNLRIADLRTLSIGNSGVTETPLYNPSLLATLTQNKLYLDYYNRYSVSELATVSGGFYFSNEMIPMGLDISSFGYDEYRESLFRISLGRQITQKWTIGIAIQYMMLQSELFEENSGRVSTDIGISFRPVENVLTGLSILHVPSFKTGDKNIDNKHITPYFIQFGFNWSITTTMLITGSIDHCEENPVAGSFGMEYMPLDDFSIRAGVRTSPLKPSLGVGYHIAGFDVDVGMVYHSVLGVSMGIGISFSF